MTPRWPLPPAPPSRVGEGSDGYRLPSPTHGGGAGGRGFFRQTSADGASGPDSVGPHARSQVAISATMVRASTSPSVRRSYDHTRRCSATDSMLDWGGIRRTSSGTHISALMV